MGNTTEAEYTENKQQDYLKVCLTSVIYIYLRACIFITTIIKISWNSIFSRIACLKICLIKGI